MTRSVQTSLDGEPLRPSKVARPIFTTFDRGAMPTFLMTVCDWRRMSKVNYRGIGWLSAARKYARSNGGAMIMLADDSLIVFTKLDDGRVQRRTYKPGTWGWAN